MNQVLLKPQQLTPDQYRDMKDNRPAGAGALKKIFFQCALREYNSDHDPVFGMVAYGGYGGKKLGPRVDLIDIPGQQPIAFPNLPLIFGNIELIRLPIDGKTNLLKELDDLIKSLKPGEFEKIKVYFMPKISKNPHVYYEVSLGGSTEATNPSPPADPSDYT